MRIKSHIRNLLNSRSIYRERKIVSFIKESGFFDEAWYLESYLDVKLAGINPIRHYIRHGASEGRDPSPSFSTKGYLDTYSDVANSGINPLLHFTRHGQFEGRAPKPVVAQPSPVAIAPVNEEKKTVFKKRRYLAVFASYNKDGRILPYVEHYLSELAKHAKIIFVSDNNISRSELNKIKPYISAAICQRHGEYDFGSYKRGIDYAREHGLFDRQHALILCNDSCVGPLYDLQPTLVDMERRKVDFWGITHSTFAKPHLQTYFLLFHRNVFQSDAFKEFFNSIERKENVSQVVLAYEIELTDVLNKAGFKWSSLRA